MVDEKKEFSPDDEYQFPADEYAAPEQTGASENASPEASPFGAPEEGSQSKPTTWKDKLRTASGGVVGKISSMRNKRILIVIIAVILLIIIVRTLHRPPATTTALPSPTETTTQTQPQTPIVDAMPVAQVQPASQPQAFQESLNAPIAQPSSEMQTALDDLRQEVSGIQNALKEAQQSDQNLQNSVGELSTQVRNLSDAVSKVLTTLAPKKPDQLAIYHLRAVVPDRAWIVTNNGETLTVSVGDKIDHYGTVIAIDAQNGTIDTSSGRRIMYGVNDF